MEFIDKSQIMQGIEQDSTADILEKGMSHKYYKREGTPGNYKYYYSEEDYKAGKSHESKLSPRDNKTIGEYREELIDLAHETNNPKLADFAREASVEEIRTYKKEKETNDKESIISKLKNRISELEYYKKAEIQTTGFVSGRTFKELEKKKKELQELEQSPIYKYREHLIDYGTKNGDKDLVEYAKTASDKQIEQRMKSDKYEEQFQDKTSQVNNLKIKENEPGWIVGEGFKIFNTGKDNHLTIKVNDNAGWGTDVHDPRRIKLMDNGKLRGSVYLPKEFKVSDISDKMYELNKETTWGEKQGFTKKDYEEILKMFLYEEMLTASSQSKTE